MPVRVVRWLVAGLAVALVATAFRVTSQVMASMADHGHDWWRIFIWQLAGWGYWTAATPLLLRRGEAIARSRPWWKPLPRALLVATSLVVLHVLFVASVVKVVQHFQPIAVYSFAEALTRQVTRWIPVDVAVVVGLPVLGFILATSHRARQLEVNESRLEAELARAELEALRLQMQPHFLFNTLNSIAALIRRGDGQAALDMVVELGAMLRDTVGRSRRDTVALRDELAFVNRYVELQSTRFADRLEVSDAIPAECLNLGVPTLSLQPLVENAIRHGLTRTREKLRVELGGSIDDGRLRLFVRDDGRGLPDDFDAERDAGLGLGNLRSRLRRMYGVEGELRVERTDGGGTTAHLVLPAIEVDSRERARGEGEAA